MAAMPCSAFTTAGSLLAFEGVLKSRECRAGRGCDEEQWPRLSNKIRHPTLHLRLRQIQGLARGWVGPREIEAEARLQLHAVRVELGCRLRHLGLRLDLGHVGAYPVVHLHGALHRQLHADVVRFLQLLVQLVVRDVVDDAVVDYTDLGGTPDCAAVHVFNWWPALGSRHKSLGLRSPASALVCLLREPKWSF